MHLNEAAAAANHRIVSLNQRRRAFAQPFPPNLSIHSIGCFFSNKRCLDTNNTISTLPPRKTSQFRFLKHMRKLLWGPERHGHVLYTYGSQIVAHKGWHLTVLHISTITKQNTDVGNRCNGSTFYISVYTAVVVQDWQSRINSDDRQPKPPYFTGLTHSKWEKRDQCAAFCNLVGVCRAQATAWRALSKVASDDAAFLTSTWSGCDSFSWLQMERELHFFFWQIQRKASY